MDYKKYITIEADKRGGKPCIRGMRITVYDVLEYLASGMSAEEILVDFPQLTADDIRACIAFAANRERELTKYRLETAVRPKYLSPNRWKGESSISGIRACTWNRSG